VIRGNIFENCWSHLVTSVHRTDYINASLSIIINASFTIKEPPWTNNPHMSWLHLLVTFAGHIRWSLHHNGEPQCWSLLVPVGEREEERFSLSL